MATLQSQPSQGKAIASMVLGICAILLSWLFGIGLVLGPIAIPLGVQANRLRHNGMATAGIVTGILGVVFFRLVVAGDPAHDGRGLTTAWKSLSPPSAPDRSTPPAPPHAGRSRLRNSSSSARSRRSAR